MFTLGRAPASAACAADIPDAPVKQASRAAAPRAAAHGGSFIVSPGVERRQVIPAADPRFRIARAVHNEIVLSACPTGFPYRRTRRLTGNPTASETHSLTITKNVYGHLLEGEKRAATEAISSALLGRPKRVAPRWLPQTRKRPREARKH
ncbi:hypothetical protein Misp03_24080 [Microbispora sp. NBRC 16548]|nr:hypothetical protein Misp03_24080 [Microbispora sp. NBRC 16548]